MQKVLYLFPAIISCKYCECHQKWIIQIFFKLFQAEVFALKLIRTQLADAATCSLQEWSFKRLSNATAYWSKSVGGTSWKRRVKKSLRTKGVNSGDSKLLTLNFIQSRENRIFPFCQRLWSLTPSHEKQEK